MVSNLGTASVDGPADGRVAGDRTSAAGVALDGVQQRLFAVALGLRRLRSRCSRTEMGAELAAIEAEVDDLIRDVRAQALTEEDRS